MGDGPLMLIIDDLQWIDPLSLEVWSELAAHGPWHSPLVSLATIRGHATTDAVERLCHRRDATPATDVDVFELETLGHTDVRELVGGMLALESPDDELVMSVFRLSEGNPLMTTELLRSAAEVGYLARTPDGDWQVLYQSHDPAHAATLPLPGSLSALIRLRMSDMSKDAQQLMNVAAVLGRECDQRLLLALCEEIFGYSPEVSRKALQQLVERQILSVVGDCHRFVHDKLREIPYESLEAGLRRKIHLQAARALDADALREPGLAGWVNRTTAGLHWSRAGERLRASACFEMAAEAACEASVTSQAADMYSAAVAELDAGGEGQTPRAAVLHERLGDVLLRSAENTRAQRSFDAALALLGDTPSVSRAELYLKLAATLQNLLDPHRALDALNQAESTVEALPNHAVPADLPSRIHVERAQICYWHGDVGAMEAALARVSPRALDGQNHALVARYFEAVAFVGFRRDRYRMSSATVSASRRAVEAARASGQTQVLLTSTWSLGMALLFASELEEARETLAQTVTLARSLGAAKQELAARAYLALNQRFLGNVGLTRTQSEELLDKASQGIMGAWCALAEANLAWVMLRRGQHSQAEQHVARARAFWRKMSTPYPFQWTALLPHLELQLRATDPSWRDTVEALLSPAQHPLPDAVAQLLGEAIREADGGAAELANEFAWRAIDEAKVGGYA
jgi:tetratricopeptide (TPR) repeat protein